jgi:hypothetical protein
LTPDVSDTHSPGSSIAKPTVDRALQTPSASQNWSSRPCAVALTVVLRPDPIDDADARTLRDALARTTIRGELELTMPARGGQSARTATLSVRACRVTLDLRDKRHETHHAAPLNVVCVTEDSPPPGHAAVEWLLLTTAPVDTFEACVEVVRGYSLRWRIEELHRAWKSGATDLEASQLWTPRNRARWRLILAAVAVQLLRVKVLSETAPQTPRDEGLYTRANRGRTRPAEG